MKNWSGVWTKYKGKLQYHNCNNHSNAIICAWNDLCAQREQNIWMSYLEEVRNVYEKIRYEEAFLKRGGCWELSGMMFLDALRIKPEWGKNSRYSNPWLQQRQSHGFLWWITAWLARVTARTRWADQILLPLPCVWWTTSHPTAKLPNTRVLLSFPQMEISPSSATEIFFPPNLFGFARTKTQCFRVCPTRLLAALGRSPGSAQVISVSSHLTMLNGHTWCQNFPCKTSLQNPSGGCLLVTRSAPPCPKPCPRNPSASQHPRLSSGIASAGATHCSRYHL